VHLTRKRECLREFEQQQKATIVAFSQKLNPHCLVLVGWFKEQIGP